MQIQIFIIILVVWSSAFGISCQNLSLTENQNFQISQDTKDKRLLAAIEANDKTEVEKLLTNGANPNAFEQRFYKNEDAQLEKTEFYDTALGLAVDGRRTQIAQLLLEHGANVNKNVFTLSKNRQEDFTLSNFHQAVINQDLPMMKLLVAHKAELKEGKEGQPLLFSVNKKEILDFLMEHDFDINEQDSAGYTYLMISIKSHHPDDRTRVAGEEDKLDLIKAILTYKPDLSLKLKPVNRLYEFKELTAMDFAKIYQLKDVIKLLNEYEAKNDFGSQK